MFGCTDEEWRQYTADLRASYAEGFTDEEMRHWDEHLQGTGEAAVRARVAWFAERRKSKGTQSDKGSSSTVSGP